MNDPVNFISSVLVLIALWVAFDAGYRSYRVNTLRDRLFELRSELFELARGGGFGERGFSDPVYLRTRRMLNGAIRYAHRFTLFRLLVLLWSSRWWLDRGRIRHEHEQFIQAFSEHPSHTRSCVEHTLLETDLAIVMHMVRVNAIGYFVLKLAGLAVRLLHVQQKARALATRQIVLNRQLLEPLEQEALDGLGRMEQR